MWSLILYVFGPDGAGALQPKGRKVVLGRFSHYTLQIPG